MTGDAPQRKGLSANWAVREVDHLFSRLGRYTRFVLYSKWFLALFAGVLLVALVIWPLIAKDNSGVRVSFIGTQEGKALGAGGAAPTMSTPVYEGTDEKGQQYYVTGDRAIQGENGLIIIENVKGTLTTASGSKVNLSATKAEYYQTQARIELIGDVNVLHDSGYHFVTPTATVDTNTMYVHGKQEVSGTGPMGNLLATGFEIVDNGSQVRFGQTGRVNVVIDQAK